jgi:ferredoxin-NADP reductase
MVTVIGTRPSVCNIVNHLNIISQRYPFKKKTISMVAGGTGITPMYQALDRLVHTPGDTTEVTLLYGNATVEDILLKAELAALEEASDGRLKVIHVLGTRQVNPTQRVCSNCGHWLPYQCRATRRISRAISKAHAVFQLMSVESMPGLIECDVA